MASELYLGLMSGTSADGVDAVIAEFDGETFKGLRGTHHLDYEAGQRLRLLELSLDQPALSLRDLSQIDAGVADTFSEAANQLLRAQAIAPKRIRALGSHGQTVFHDGPQKLTMQLGDPSRIAERTGITVVADFRRRDLALGGQGAPLVPAFHHALFATANEARCVVNIGGIANVTLLPSAAETAVRGFDTGPGNALMDEWMQIQRRQPFDRDGAFAASGRANQPLLDALLADPYFALAPPKSTGRDYFRLDWARQRFPRLAALSPKDVQATLCETTAASIAKAIHGHLPNAARVLVCGGGARSGFLMQRMRSLLSPAIAEPTDILGLDAEWVEAAAFAWLAMRTIKGLSGNLPAVTGARAAAVLGGIYPARTS